MKNQLKTLIPKAINAIRAVNIPTDDTKMEVPSVYHGYVSSFGAGIVQAGLLPAVIFFENSEGDGQKYKITQAIRLLLENSASVPDNLDSTAYRLSDHIMDRNHQYDSKFLKEVSLMAVAIKIALRTFKKIDHE